MTNKFKSIDYWQLSDKQQKELKSFYATMSQRYSAHLRKWKEIIENDGFVAFINHMDHDKLQKKLHQLRQKNKYNKLLDFIEINDKKYFMIYCSHVLALFDTTTNEVYVYHKVFWQSSYIGIWINMNNGYGWSSNPVNSLSGGGKYSLPKPNKYIIEKLRSFDEFKYINLKKFEYIDTYMLMENRFNKQHLWQVEMLLKGGFTRLASELHETHEILNHKIVHQYEKFFKMRGKGLNHYYALMRLRDKGFTNTDFVYLTWQEYFTYEFSFINFLEKHPEMKRDKFIKYIKNRKSSPTIFGREFLKVYEVYLTHIEKLKLDLSKDKYAFPDDLIKNVEEMLQTMPIYDLQDYGYDYRNLVIEMYEHWQFQLSEEELDARYSELLQRLKLERDEQAERNRRIAAKKLLDLKRKQAEKDRLMKALWEMNKFIRFIVSEKYVIQAPKSSDELFIEGKTLNHCVYQYLDRMAKKETNILFLRKIGHEEKPFYTIEIKDGKVIQCRSTNNIVKPEITNMVSDWYNTNKEEVNKYLQ